MRNKFDMQLERLNSQLTHMGEMCEIAITRATKALEDGKVDEAKAVQEADEEIDQLEKDIERLCLKLLLQQQPVARDLRQTWNESEIRHLILRRLLFPRRRLRQQIFRLL